MSDRSKLKPRRDPYWQRLAQGCYLGLRRISASSEGAWSARFFSDAEAKQVYKPLGDFKELPGHLRFDAAVAAANEWFVHLGKGGSPGSFRVIDACNRYVDHLSATKGQGAADDARDRFVRHVSRAPSGFASIELSKLTPMHVSRWRKWLQESPIVSGHRKGEARSGSALNRDLTPLRAALNRALADGLASADFAWRQQLKPIPDAGSRRTHYFTKEQRAALRDGAREDFQKLLTLVFALPIRPGAIAQLRVSHFDCNLRTLTIGKDKFGANRQVKLPSSIASVIEDYCRGKPPNAYIVNQNTGRPWGKDAWKDLFKKAAVIAGLPEDSVMTNLRHSSITDLMQSGIDPLTVAQLAGTSISMIQKHYGHLTQDRAQAALENLFIA